MALIDSAYQYYLSTYRNSTVSRYDTHKKSELRDVYNQMVKVNKNSPLYKIKNKGELKYNLLPYLSLIISLIKFILFNFL